MQKIDYLVAEYCWSDLKSENVGILGSGLLIANPPWKLNNRLLKLNDFFPMCI